ncbi:MAG: squalene--hopene cyclase [Planctomycetes bacterium]|nr:squalene--hopene cyclase [Planctomycetota bacterium]
MKRGAIDSDLGAIKRTLSAARERLLACRVPAGHWEGTLSSSALSTATATCALDLVRRNGGEDLSALVRAGLRWLADHQNEDGGFGDTPASPSNISTTALCWASLGMNREYEAAFSRAEAWLKKNVGDLTAPSLAEAIARRYGEDRTFSVPILTMCALAGRFGEGRRAWESIPSLPFELAALPRFLFRWLNLQVVSYALPALIAIGQARHVHRPTRNPFARLPRWLARNKTLRLLESIQPDSGGFLEATPLTSFVTMSLAASGQVEHAVNRKGAAFLKASAREDGSWSIDTNLSTWVTTLSVQALTGALDDRTSLRAWLLGQQTRVVHPYTQSAPGGWAWTDLSGGVPDADDTAGALLALFLLRDGDDPEARRAARAGIRWLLDVQNGDGGIPTFCRGWGKLPFDRSCPDLTAHALRAWSAWRPELEGPLAIEMDGAMNRAFDYLVRTQRAEGAWIPLWFGNHGAADETNPVYGTSRVMLCSSTRPEWRRARDRAAAWLLSAQHADGGFRGGPDLPPTIEETALAVDALAGHEGDVTEALTRGCRWLVTETEEGTRFPPAPIGFYFAKLWYWEKLYPVIFCVSALRRALRRVGS